MSQQSNDNVIKIVPHIVGSLIATTVYIVISLMMKDWVLSKPWLGFAGVMAAALGVFSGMGFVVFIGVPFVSICMGIPCILIGKKIIIAIFFCALRQTNSLL